MLIKLKKDFSFEDVFSGAWKVFSQDTASIIVLPLIANIPFFIVSFIAGTGVGAESITDFFASDGFNSKMGVYVILFLALVVAGIFLGITAFIAVVTIVDNILHKKEVNLSAIFSDSMNKFWPMVWVFIVKNFLLIFLFLLLIIPGIIFTVYWLFAEYIFVLKGERGMKALDYSKKITKGKWWKIFLYLFLASLIVGIPSVIFTGVFTAFSKNFVVLQIVNVMVSVLVNGLMMSFYVVFFRFMDYAYIHSGEKNLEANDIKELGEVSE
jgi:hypothetical protein